MFDNIMDETDSRTIALYNDALIGNADAQYGLGDLHFKGVGVSKDGGGGCETVYACYGARQCRRRVLLRILL